jgi:NADH pyrophosphatase NudC (nudix superfamily)
MEWTAALEIVIARTKHEPYRTLCADAHPKHERWRRIVIKKATGQAPTPESYPSLFVQAKNLAGAAARFAASGFKLVDDAELARRKSICAECPHWRSDSRRCVKCGCKTDAKLRSAAEQCPDNPPRWPKVTP